ncbi:MAG: hypothetical protein SPL98_03845 [Bacteroidales bacterium]|nr:hypothetical protein [Bacteroidales bacterium]MDY6395894.1 hypothetical protein [Bacteroidales bacterium]MDY6403105.1 hypothetical protein [Bacteroidales bacterium]MDY6424388.1 hypothetical protein [Bacteroidales bacterium]
MLDFFEKDSFLSGFILSLLLNIAGAGIIYGILWLINADVLLNIKAFIFSVLPSIFLLRYQMKQGKINAFRGSVFTLIVCLLGIFICFLNMNIFDNPFNQKIKL